MTQVTDEELAAALVPDLPVVEGLRIVGLLAPDRRAGYERLVIVGRELDLYEAGLGPAPDGVIMTRAKGRFRG